MRLLELLPLCARRARARVARTSFKIDQGTRSGPSGKRKPSGKKQKSGLSGSSNRCKAIAISTFDTIRSNGNGIHIFIKYDFYMKFLL